MKHATACTSNDLGGSGFSLLVLHLQGHILNTALTCALTLSLQVQRAAAGALRTLAFKNEDNKNLIVSEGALPVLIQMLKAEDAGIHYEAVGVIGNLVHSSPHIKKKVR